LQSKKYLNYWRPRGFEPLTLGLEIRGFVVTNYTELHRFVILRRVYENGLKTRSPKLRNYNEKEINFYLSFASGFGVLG